MQHPTDDAAMNSAVEQWPRTHRLTVDEYYKMAEVGVLAPDARVELIEGVIIDMPPIGSPHAGIVNILTKRFVNAVGERAVVSIQLPVRLNERSEPQPDLAVLRPRKDMYGGSHPTPADVLLIVEVSESTLQFDLGRKSSLYAKNGIPEVWVFDVKNRRLHCMREPQGDRYGSATTYQPPACVAVAALPDVQIDLAQVFL